MSQNASFVRKIIYGCAIVVLLFPLFFLGQPATSSRAETEAGQAATTGGKLALLRSDYGLSQAELGEIDPASETMKLATLGLRGVATNLLWTRADNYKMTESWDKLSATLNQIAKLQPNYISVWEYQAHNLSYNVSAEFDDYRSRYHWVKKGLEFLLEGTKYNHRNPRLFWSLGWFTGHKIGRSDEHVQFREMFRKDKDFHEQLMDYVTIDNARGPEGPDNWLVAYLWYKQSEAVVDKGVPTTWMRLDVNQEGYTDKRRSPVIFYSDPSMALIAFADAITAEIIPGERTRQAWRRAGEEWEAFGSMDIPTTFGHSVRLNNVSDLRKETIALRDQLEQLSPGLREKIREQRHTELSPEERAIFDAKKRTAEMSEEEMASYARAFRKMTVSDMEVAEAMPKELRSRALNLARRAAESADIGDHTATYAEIVNYDYWKTRCKVESTPTTADARRYMRLGDEDGAKAMPDTAKVHYEKAWDEWAKIFEEYPELINDDMAEDLKEVIFRYKLVLDQLDEEFPKNFKLQVLAQSDEEDEPGLGGGMPGGLPPPPTPKQ